MFALITAAGWPVYPLLVASIIAVGVAQATEPHVRPGDIAWRVVFLAAAWLLGDSIGSRRAYVQELEAKAERLEREQEAQARRAAAADAVG